MSRKRQTIEARRVDTLSPWVSLVEVAVRQDGEPVETHHGLEVADYVVVCARSSSGLIPVVRQFRPILGRTTLEFPAGLVDEGEAPAIAAAREFNEETGLIVRACSLSRSRRTRRMIETAKPCGQPCSMILSPFNSAKASYSETLLSG